MMRRPILAFFLALVLAAGTILSGPPSAQAETITVELCSDAGAVTVTLDAQGNPVTARHRACPLCLAAVDVGLASAPAGWSRPNRAAQGAVPTPASPRAIKGHRAAPTARAPPLPV